MKELDNVAFIEFGENDIVRSKKVKDYIIAKNRLGLVA
jgi:phosphate starvation-inducible protein PhoH